MTEYRLCTYTPIEDNEITLQANAYKEYISNEPDVHSVKWVYCSINKHTKAETGQKRKTENICVAHYECHRAGSPRARKNQPTVSKKIGCPATLVISCPEDNQHKVILRYSGEHNHVPGSIDDMRHLPISQNLRDIIEERLKSGFDQCSVRASIIKYFNVVIRSQYKDIVEGSHVIIHRDQFLHGDEIYNIYRRIQEKSHPDSETGFSLAYCFTNDHSTTPLVEFLTFLSVLGIIPNKITIVVSKTELAAIEMVFPTVNVQWCLFHVGRAWMQKN
ncbi:hypothetical protein K501DRAFT_274191 [Backusella circina FSU 941]|nr:hypothetical protein K501DRAFT_274191 [Backusella circina FSU 941]